MIKIDKKELIRLYKVENFKIKDISNIYKCNIWTVIRRLRKYGIKLNIVKNCLNCKRALTDNSINHKKKYCNYKCKFLYLNKINPVKYRRTGTRKGKYIPEESRKKICLQCNCSFYDKHDSNKSKFCNPHCLYLYHQQPQYLAHKVLLKNNCEICGSKNRLEKHHWRYDKPTLVNTLCRTCHNIQHGRLKRLWSINEVNL